MLVTGRHVWSHAYGHDSHGVFVPAWVNKNVWSSWTNVSQFCYIEPPPLDTTFNAKSLSFSILFFVTLPTAKSLVKDLAALVTSDFVIAPLEPLYTSMAMSIRYMQQIPVSMQFNLLKKFIPSLLGLNFVMENIREFKAILCYNSLNNFESL